MQHAFPRFLTHGVSLDADTRTLQRALGGALAAVSLFLAAGLVVLVGYGPPLPQPWNVLAIPLGLVVLAKMGLFAWVADARLALAIRHSPLNDAVAERSRAAFREWFLTPGLREYIQTCGSTMVDVHVEWTWAPEGLRPTTISARTPEGGSFSESAGRLNAGTSFRWGDPELASLARHAATLRSGRWHGHIRSVAPGIPIGSAHARLKLHAWALGG